MEPEQQFQDYLSQSKGVVILTGAGISVASGIETYRDENNEEKTLNHEALSNISNIKTLKRNPALFWSIHRAAIVDKLGASPNKGHHACVAIENYCKENQKNFLLITQNIDGLHNKAGSSSMVEIHGHSSEIYCMNINCRKKYITEKYFERFPDVQIPKCPVCQGVLRPDVVLHGEKYSTEVINLVKSFIKEKADLFISIGASFLLSSPVSSFPRVFKAYNPSGKYVEFNLRKTRYAKPYGDLVVEGDCDPALERYTRGL